MKRGLHISSSSFPFRNFSLNQTLKQPSYLAFRSLHSGPIEFISESRSQVDKCHKDNYQIPSRQILNIHLTDLKLRIDKYQITIDKYQHWCYLQLAKESSRVILQLHLQLQLRVKKSSVAGAHGFVDAHAHNPIGANFIQHSPFANDHTGTICWRGRKQGRQETWEHYVWDMNGI